MRRIVQELTLKKPRRQAWRRHHPPATSFGLTPYGLWIAVRQKTAAADDEHVVAHLGFFHIGGADEDGQLFFRHQAPKDLPEIAAGQGIYPHRRLVKEQEVRRTHQRAG